MRRLRKWIPNLFKQPYPTRHTSQAWPPEIKEALCTGTVLPAPQKYVKSQPLGLRLIGFRPFFYILWGELTTHTSFVAVTPEIAIKDATNVG